MFLFLSKLLPLFFYPLGLSCLLMLVTLMLWWKRSRWTPIPSWSGQQGLEADDMAELLQLMGVPATAIIQESESLNTRQNAVNVKEIIQQENIKKIILITSAFHLPRSLLIFKKLGINPIPAPTDFFVTVDQSPPSLEGIILGILPDAHRLSLTTLALKEYLGIIIYRLRGWL